MEIRLNGIPLYFANNDLPFYYGSFQVIQDKALEAFRASPSRYDIVILDVAIPQMRGRPFGR